LASSVLQVERNFGYNLSIDNIQLSLYIKTTINTKEFFMKNKGIILTAFGLGGLLLGIILTAVIGFYSMPGMMMLEDESPYDFAKTVERFELEVRAGGWSVLQVHNMKEILAKHGHDVLSVTIYELCSSRYSLQILSLDNERIVAPLMPCRVAIYEKSNGKTYIGRMNSVLMAMPFGGVINQVMQSAGSETEDVIRAVLK
jgi:uncharacterized protein (DUF302 family)